MHYPLRRAMSHAGPKTGEMKVMEATLTVELTAETVALETQNDDLSELSNVELVLVGGGMGAVVFF